eukprot:434026-Pleurochrysis_carterae.AAC.1
MNEALAGAIPKGQQRPRAVVAHTHAQAAVTGGRIADGPALSPAIRALIDEARREPAAFASLRNLAPETGETLATAPMPGDLRTPQPTAPSGKRRRAKARKPLPRPSPAPGPAPRAAPAAPVQGAEIPIEALFLPGVYAERVQTWFARADAAVAASLRRRGRGEDVPVPAVPTVVVSQLEMP